MEIMTTPDRAVRYGIELPDLDVKYVSFAWPTEIVRPLDAEIIELMRETTASAPIIGFATTITDAEGAGYIRELRENLAAGKCRLLVIRASHGRLVGLCTLRRNLNPNNRHIADLAKGMIAPDYRGRHILSAAFHEISLQCERDGVEVVTLDVRADTHAHHVWERFGFEIYGTLKDYARVNGAPLAGHFMMQKVADLKSRALDALHAKTGKHAANESRQS